MFRGRDLPNGLLADVWDATAAVARLPQIPVGRDSVEPILPPPAVRAQRASWRRGRGKMLTAFASLRSKVGSTECRPTGVSMHVSCLIRRLVAPAVARLPQIPVGRDSVEPILPPPAVRAQRASWSRDQGRMLTAFASRCSKVGSTECRPTGVGMHVSCLIRRLVATALFVQQPLPNSTDQQQSW